MGVAEGTNLPACLDTVDPRQHQVEHDHVGGTLTRELDGRLAVRGGVDVEALPLEVRADEPRERLFVLDDERARAGRPLPARLGPCHAHSLIETKRPCHQWYQGAPVTAFTDIIPAILPPRSRWSV